MNSGGWNVDLTPFLPELVFAGGFLVLIVLGLFFRRERGTVTAICGTILLALAAILAAMGDERIGPYLFGSVIQDGATIFFRIFFCLATAISLGMLLFRFSRDAEPFLLALASVIGMFLLAGAGDIVTLFVALEVVSIPSYVLAGYKRHDIRSAEAALKYVLYGALSSGIMLFGFSYLYGLTGETSLSGIAARLTGGPGQETAFLAALLMVLIGIGYKIAMVPVHFWCPDVYEGSPTAVTAFLSVAPKAAGFAALYRLMAVFLPLDTWHGANAVLLFTVASAITMTFGNLGAIWQSSLKRLLAYSSIAHAGYILMGFAVLASNPSAELYRDASTAIFFYLAVYLFMNLGAFLVVEFVERRRGGETIEYFRGLGKTDTIPALLLAVFLFSLTGLPPLAGFVGKFLLFAALVKGQMFGLAIIGIANTVVSLYYYVRVIRDMYLHDPVPEINDAVNSSIRMSGLAGALALITIVPTLVLGLWWGPLASWLNALI